MSPLQVDFNNPPNPLVVDEVHSGPLHHGAVHSRSQTFAQGSIATPNTLLNNDGKEVIAPIRHLHRQSPEATHRTKESIAETATAIAGQYGGRQDKNSSEREKVFFQDGVWRTETELREAGRQQEMVNAARDALVCGEYIAALRRMITEQGDTPNVTVDTPEHFKEAV